MPPRILLWYRQDLRLHDHEPLYRALALGAEILPFYGWDPRHFLPTVFGFLKTGAFRAHFLVESLADLRQSLQQRGSDLVIRQGYPEQTIPDLAAQWSIQAVYTYGAVTPEETAVEDSLRLALAPLGIPLTTFFGHTLYHPDDLPFAMTALPELFTTFRKKMEAGIPIRSPFPTPQHLPALPDIALEAIPDLDALGIPRPIRDPRALHTFLGGEAAGLAHCHRYIWTDDHLRHYKETRNGMLLTQDSSKFSPWLALGCLSPRWIYAEVQRYETEILRNDSTYWLIFELLWRDYFYWIAAKYGPRLFRPSGLQGIPIPWSQDRDLWECWCQGRTGYPLVDANLQELAATGFMSNRGRQNVASFLTKNLGVDWRLGAAWFESLLIDYDVSSNWGNWNYTAGVGHDARGFRYFNIPKQSQDYDPQGVYLRHWLPALAGIPGDRIHEPYRLTIAEQAQWGVRLGVDYPRPVVALATSVQVQERIYRQALTQHRTLSP